MSAATKEYATLEARFRKFHTYSVNIGLHAITTPLGLAGFLGLLNLASIWLPLAVSVAYVISLKFVLPSKTFFRTALVSVGIMGFTAAIEWSVFRAAMAMAASFVFQELAHIITGEQTYQAQYIGQSDWKNQLVEHTYYLLPLVVDAMEHMHFSMLGFVVAHNRVFYTKLDKEQQKKDLKLINDWVLAQGPSKEHTTHWWYDKLEGDVKEAFARTAACESMVGMFKESFGEKAYEIETIDEMNEIYVASPNYGMNSDGVFYMRHVDGPYGIFPFASAYRSMVAVNFNQQIKTSFPMVPAAKTLSNGDAVTFDFNREIHLISDNETKNTGFRICMKIHYCVYPKVLRPWGKLLKYLNIRYNKNARALFLATIAPGSVLARASALMVLGTTYLTERVECLMGMNNLVYVLCLAVGNYTVHPLCFLIGTSFLHYIIYMGTFYSRRDIAFGTFKRDVMFFKAIAIAQLVYFYLKNFEFDMISLALLTVGYTIAIAATQALGIDKTYFGSELGHCPPQYISAFPYNCIPHPMIVGACIGLLGFHKLAGLREEMPYLVPVHIALYLTHMMQEILDFHRNRPGVMKASKTE